MPAPEKAAKKKSNQALKDLKKNCRTPNKSGG
jgi:hypothetical protein